MNARIPRTERDHVLVDVKATPLGWPTASLDPDSGRGRQATSGMPAPGDPQNQVSTVSGDCRPPSRRTSLLVAPQPPTPAVRPPYAREPTATTRRPLATATPASTPSHLKPGQARAQAPQPNDGAPPRPSAVAPPAMLRNRRRSTVTTVAPGSEKGVGPSPSRAPLNDLGHRGVRRVRSGRLFVVGGERGRWTSPLGKSSSRFPETVPGTTDRRLPSSSPPQVTRDACGGSQFFLGRACLRRRRPFLADRCRLAGKRRATPPPATLPAGTSWAERVSGGAARSWPNDRNLRAGYRRNRSARSPSGRNVGSSTHIGQK